MSVLSIEAQSVDALYSKSTRSTCFRITARKRQSHTMGSIAKYILLLLLAMSMEVMANDTESVDLFTVLDQTCPYWQALSSGICLIKYSLSQNYHF